MRSGQTNERTKERANERTTACVAAYGFGPHGLWAKGKAAIGLRQVQWPFLMRVARRLASQAGPGHVHARGSGLLGPARILGALKIRLKLKLQFLFASRSPREVEFPLLYEKSDPLAAGQCAVRVEELSTHSNCSTFIVTRHYESLSVLQIPCRRDS